MFRYPLFIVTLFSAILNNLCLAQITLHITTGFTPPVSDFFNKVLDEADKRLDNISISFEHIPAERALKLADQGVNDGECCRIPEVVVHEYTNLKASSVSIFSARFSVFTRNTETKIKSFDDLAPYTVGTIAGWKIAIKKIKEIKPAEFHLVTTPEQLMNMLDQGRLDYGVVGYLSGLKAIAALKLDSVKAVEPPLIEKNLYLLLHEKHQELLPAFDRVFRKMKNDGTIDRIYNNLLETFNKN